MHSLVAAVCREAYSFHASLWSSAAADRPRGAPFISLKLILGYCRLITTICKFPFRSATVAVKCCKRGQRSTTCDCCTRLTITAVGVWKALLMSACEMLRPKRFELAVSYSTSSTTALVDGPYITSVVCSNCISSCTVPCSVIHWLSVHNFLWSWTVLHFCYDSETGHENEKTDYIYSLYTLQCTER